MYGKKKKKQTTIFFECHLLLLLSMDTALASIKPGNTKHYCACAVVLRGCFLAIPKVRWACGNSGWLKNSMKGDDKKLQTFIPVADYNNTRWEYFFSYIVSDLYWSRFVIKPLLRCMIVHTHVHISYEVFCWDLWLSWKMQ